MWAHLQAAGVQQHYCRTLGHMCGGTDAAAPARQQRAVGGSECDLQVDKIQAIHAQGSTAGALHRPEPKRNTPLGVVAGLFKCAPTSRNSSIDFSPKSNFDTCWSHFPLH